MKDILEKINQRKEKLAQVEYPKKEEIFYMDNLGIMIDFLYRQKKPDYFKITDLFLVCHMAYNPDDDFEKLKDMVTSSVTLLKEIIDDLDKIKGSVFEKEKYLDTIKRINVLYRRKKIFYFSKSKIDLNIYLYYNM